MKILIPLDGSRLSDAALSHVRRLLVGRPAEVRLLHVVPAGAPLEARAVARRHLAACVTLLESAGLRATTRTADGDPVNEILDEAIDGQVDLVAMSTNGRTGLRRWARGSVAERVLRACPAPLLLVNPAGLRLADDEVRYRRILVPLDGTHEAGEALGPVGALAAACGAEVMLLLVGDAGAARERARALAGGLKGILEARGVVRVGVADAFGETAGAILTAARDLAPDLLALATGPRSWRSPWPLGPVVERVTRRAPCPLLLLRAGYAVGVVGGAGGLSGAAGGGAPYSNGSSGSSASSSRTISV
jgi:nucleotide-binding universal stress UspA family protein